MGLQAAYQAVSLQLWLNIEHWITADAKSSHAAWGQPLSEGDLPEGTSMPQIDQLLESSPGSQAYISVGFSTAYRF